MKRTRFMDSPAMAPNSSTSAYSTKSVGAVVLQSQNQKLIQQLDIQKQKKHDLETKVKELKDKQTSYDNTLITVNRHWNQAGNHSFANHVEQALSSRYSSARELITSLENIFTAERVEADGMAASLQGKLSVEDTIMQLSKIDDKMKGETKKLRMEIDTLQLKHEEYADAIQTCISSHSTNQSEIKNLKGELEEVMAELEESGRKLVSLKMQKNAASGSHASISVAANCSLSPEKLAVETMGLREIKDLIEDTKIVAAVRLSELQEAQEKNQIYSKQLKDLQNELQDDKFIHLSWRYTLLNDQLQNWNTKMEQYKALTDALQREKELNMKDESANDARNIIDNADYRVEELKLQLQKFSIERNDLEIKMEEAIQNAGRNDVKEGFRVMASALSMEMGMLEVQLNRWKEAAHDANSLREEAKALKVLLSDKTNQQRLLAEECAEQIVEIKSLYSLIEKLRKEKLELQVFLDMCGQEGYDNRDIAEIRESENRAYSQAEALKNALDEDSLELRVKAANEGNTIVQERLSIAEAEIAELRAKLVASDRGVLELLETLKSKDQELCTYISEIETIGPAYEDMETLNKLLLQKMSERDDHSIKLVSENEKTKQAYSFVLSENETLARQLQQVNSSMASMKTRIAHSEEQMNVCLTEATSFTQEDRRFMISLETAKWQLADAEEELKWLRSAAESSGKDYEQLQQQVDEFRFMLDLERSQSKKLEEDRSELNSQRKKLEEDLSKSNSEAAQVSSETGETALKRLQYEIIEMLQDEIKNCKNILKCSMCFDRPKEVVIVKCCHLFCNPCIQRNLEIGHRKCPACGSAFAQNDVQYVKM